ncbi:hypothetical protein BY996DRAFT_8399168 [Phakopsora pachyrhizi]|nr:hypothetical protein BY996DRAFT_8399168 [Phakopsora pachyrhizi]
MDLVRRMGDKKLMGSYGLSKRKGGSDEEFRIYRVEWGDGSKVLERRRGKENDKEEEEDDEETQLTPKRTERSANR